MLTLITLIPLVWLLSVTFTAGIQKVWSSDPKVGFLAAAKVHGAKVAEAYPATGLAKDDAALAAAQLALATNKRLVLNNLLDAVIAVGFLVLVTALVLLSVREWIVLWLRRKPVVLHETEPVWLPDYAVLEGGRKLGGVAGAATLTLALARELSGEAQLARAQEQLPHCECGPAEQGDGTAQKIYVEVTEQRFNGIRRCC